MTTDQNQKNTMPELPSEEEIAEVICCPNGCHHKDNGPKACAAITYKIEAQSVLAFLRSRQTTNAGDGHEPSTFAADLLASPSVSRRGEPAPDSQPNLVERFDIDTFNSVVERANKAEVALSLAQAEAGRLREQNDKWSEEIDALEDQVERLRGALEIVSHEHRANFSERTEQTVYAALSPSPAKATDPRRQRTSHEQSAL